jgi:hypothetical protein
MDDECFIFNVTLTDEGKGSRIQPLLSRFNTAAIIDNQAEANGDIFVLEYRDFLLGPVLENAEIFLFQVTYRMVLLVSDIDMNLRKIHVNAQFE